MARIIALLLVVLSAACGRDQPANERFIEPLDPADVISSASIELGKWLFFEPRLSSNGTMSCSTCHLPEQAWTDGKVTSPKHDGSANTRNSPTMYNVGSLDRLYWDGRAPSLEKNILAAWKSQLGGDPEAVSAVLAAVPQYRAQLRLAGIDLASKDGVANGIVSTLAAFLRILQSANSPFDRWRAGAKDAINADAKQGYQLFLGKAGCAVCHQEPLFTDRGFHNTGVGMDAAKPDPGAGGEKARNDPKLIGYFKTPTLREIAVTAPYFHDGSVAKLEDAVRFMASGGRDNPTKSPELINRFLSDAEIGQLTEFLRTLTSNQAMKPPVLPR